MGLLEHPQYTRPANFRGMEVLRCFYRETIRRFSGGAGSGRWN